MSFTYYLGHTCRGSVCEYKRAEEIKGGAGADRGGGDTATTESAGGPATGEGTGGAGADETSMDSSLQNMKLSVKTNRTLSNHLSIGNSHMLNYSYGIDLFVLDSSDYTVPCAILVG